MLEEAKTTFNWQRLLITLGIVLFTALVVGGTTWYIMDRSAQELQATNDSSIERLQEQINELKPANTDLIEKVNVPTQTNSNNNSATPTNDWKLFSLTGYRSIPRLAFKYPSNEIVTDSSATDSSVWLSPDGTRANTTLSLYFEPSRATSPQLIFEAKVKSPGVPEPYSVIGNVKIGSIDCYQVNYNHMGQGSTSLYFFANNFSYTVNIPTNELEKYKAVIASLTF